MTYRFRGPKTETRGFGGRNALGRETTVFSGQVGLTKDVENQGQPWKNKAQHEPQPQPQPVESIS
jgi:hypothetical protein